MFISDQRSYFMKRNSFAVLVLLFSASASVLSQTNGSGLLQILKPFSSEWWDIRITNVSREGMRLNVPFRVPQGSLVKVKMENSLYFGETRYCEPASDDFFYVGVHLRDFYTRERVSV